MRRSILAISTVGLLMSLVFAGPTGATVSADHAVPLRLHKSWIQWAFGDSGAPLLDPEFCGEKVGGLFYMTVAGGSPTSVIRRIDCEIPRRTPILVTPGGSIWWNAGDRALRNSVFTELMQLRVHSVHVKLDGIELKHGPLVVPDPYDLPLEPGNLIQTVDPSVTGDSTRLAEAWYFVLLPPLSPGHHVLIASDVFDYRSTGGEVAKYRTRFDIHVD